MLRLNYLLLFLTLASCMDNTKFNIPTPKKSSHLTPKQQLPKEEVYDKILGALVGSAIGDAMGASTEMWNRKLIQERFGYITGLTPVLREKSPEGVWKHNMLAGATTDDTRWKYFLGQYLSTNQNDLSGGKLANFIVEYYEELLNGLKESKVKASTDVLDAEMEKVNWIKEWARVAMAYGKSESLFAAAQSRFYGGEMSCAGMLFSPMFALISSNAEDAYLKSFEHCIFDIGYARDISSLLSSMTYNAMFYADMDSILEQSILVDPHSYADSRLIGRLGNQLASEARLWVNSNIEIPVLLEGEVLDSAPSAFQGSAEDWYRQNVIYDRMATKQREVAFHAGEVWQILIAGLEFGQGDFLKTLQFIVNYGRDNDTVAAIAGMILGAKIGYEKIPHNLKTNVLMVSKETMGIDLEKLARKMEALNPIAQ